MSPVERSLLVHRLRAMAQEHHRVEADDQAADTADTLCVAIARDGMLCGNLLEDAARALIS